jgi:hypothetical protein
MIELFVLMVLLAIVYFVGSAFKWAITYFVGVVGVLVVLLAMFLVENPKNKEARPFK